MKTRKRRRTTTRNNGGSRQRYAPAAHLALATAVLLLCAVTLFAQKKKEDDSNTRSLQGIVFDPEGNPAVQAVVQLKDSRTLQVISFITKQDGAYHFAGLRQDTEYQVKAEHLGTTTDWKRLSIFDTRKMAEMNLKLNKKAEKQ
jgi:hypothetical protein